MIRCTLGFFFTPFQPECTHPFQNVATFSGAAYKTHQELSLFSVPSIL